VGGFRISVWDVQRNLWSDVVPQQSPPIPSVSPVWSPADTAIVFRTTQNTAVALGGGTMVTVRTADRSTRAFPDDSASRLANATDWSRDGRHIAISNLPSARARFAEAWVIDPVTGARRRMFEETASVGEIRFAPDGRRVAYERTEGNSVSLYVRPFPGAGSAVRVTAGSGRRPVWSAEGRSLFFEDADGNIAVVPVSASGEATNAPAIALPQERIEQLLPEYGGFRFDVAPNTNEIFVMASGSRRHTLTLVQNWRALLTPK
jgi:Tol biopolymer transport system component